MSAHSIICFCLIVSSTVHCVNLDPAAETFDYPVAIDIRDLVSLSDVMESLDYGPNGGLVYALDYLASHLSFLSNQVADYQDDYLVIDWSVTHKPYTHCTCHTHAQRPIVHLPTQNKHKQPKQPQTRLTHNTDPLSLPLPPSLSLQPTHSPGQIELYTHLPIMRDIVSHLEKEGYRVCAVWCLDSVFITDISRFVSGVMMCLSAMIQLELPHINVLTKCDQLHDKALIDKYTDPDMTAVLAELRAAGERGEVTGGSGGGGGRGGGGWARLNEAVSGLIEQYSMVSFVALDLSDEESVDVLLMHVDNALQYGEDVEPQEPVDEQDVDIEPGDERLG